MKARLFAVLLAALFGGVASAWAECPQPQPGEQALQGTAVQARWQAEPTPIVVGQPFALRVTLCPADAQLLRVDARMPEHKHGMNYRPSVTALGAGQWQVQGLLWHMRGRWELSLDVKVSGGEERLVQSLMLP